MSANRHLNILGIRGIPAAHGGFETFVARFAPDMIEHGWSVTVYCQGQASASRPRSWTDSWNGIERVFFDTASRGSLSTIEFDARCVRHILRRPGIDLVLGYNTAAFNLLQRLFGRIVVMNMDGIEWKRQKWGPAAKAWFWLNEWIGAQSCSLPIADNPEIVAHLHARGCHRAYMIPYGSEAVAQARAEHLTRFGVSPQSYFISIARIEPENAILEIVSAFNQAATPFKLIVLGGLETDSNPYHAQVKSSAGPNVFFPGAIYDQEVVQALRYHSIAYLHGHQVGGTNPSLVEALGTGTPVIAHNNKFNRWVAGDGQLFFDDAEDCARKIKRVASDPGLRTQMSENARSVHAERFTLERIHNAYREILETMADGKPIPGAMAGTGRTWVTA